MEDRSLRLPSVEPLLLLPVPIIVHSVSNRNEARLLLGIGELAHEFDHLMSYLPQWLEHQEYLKDDCERAAEMTACQMSSLAPLTSQARSVNLHGVKLLQARITECLQKMKKHMETVQVFANQNASFASELRLCGLGDRADQRHRLAEIEAILVNRLFKFLGSCDSFFDEPPLALVVGSTAEAVAGGKDAADGQAYPEADGNLNPSTMPGGKCGKLVGRKRPLPKGKERSDGSRAYSGVREGIAGDATEAVREETACHDGTDDREGSSIHPEIFCQQDVASTLSNRGERDTPQTQTRTRTMAAADVSMPSRSTSQTQLVVKDGSGGFTAPSFLTPLPVVGAAASRVAVAPPVDSVAVGLAPLGAYSPAVSTPSNGSSSPALAVASMTPRPSRRPGSGRAGVSREGSGGKGAGGEEYGIFVGDGGGQEDGAVLNEGERQFYSSSQTQTSTSTREPSPPPAFSTGEESSSTESDRSREKGQGDDGEVRNQDNEEEEKSGHSVTSLSERSASGVVNASVADAVAGKLSPLAGPDPDLEVLGVSGRGPSEARGENGNTGIATGKDGFAHTAERATDCERCPREEDGEADEPALHGRLSEGEEYDEGFYDSMETLADFVEVEDRASAPWLPPEADRLPPVAHRDNRVDQDNTDRRHEGDRDAREGEATAARASDRALNGNGEQQQRGAAALVARRSSTLLSQCSAGADVAGGMETETDTSGGSVAFEEPKNDCEVLTQEE